MHQRRRFNMSLPRIRCMTLIRGLLLRVLRELLPILLVRYSLLIALPILILLCIWIVVGVGGYAVWCLGYEIVRLRLLVGLILLLRAEKAESPV
jgi:hypothetical protein